MSVIEPLEASEHDFSLGRLEAVHETGNAPLVVVITEEDELAIDEVLVGDGGLGLVVEVQFTLAWSVATR